MPSGGGAGDEVLVPDRAGERTTEPSMGVEALVDPVDTIELLFLSGRVSSGGIANDGPVPVDLSAIGMLSGEGNLSDSGATSPVTSIELREDAGGAETGPTLVTVASSVGGFGEDEASRAEFSASSSALSFALKERKCSLGANVSTRFCFFMKESISG